MATHPGCSCSLVPIPAGWDAVAARQGVSLPPGEWGVAGEESGASAFGRLPDADKLRILGPGKFAAYRDGAISLDDLVEEGSSATWGRTRREASLAGALDRAGKRGGGSSGVPPGDSSGSGGDDEPIAWSPTMPEEQARHWARQDGGVLADDTFYHFTSIEGAAVIEAEGIRRSLGGGLLGNYLYTTTDGTRTGAARAGARNARVRLNVVLKASRVLDRTYAEAQALVEAAAGAGYAGFGGDGEYIVNVAEYLREQGYDALRVSPASGAKSWLLPTAREQAVVIGKVPFDELPLE